MSSSLNPQNNDALIQLNALTPDSLQACSAQIEGETESLIVYRDANGDVHAWLNVCPHAGRRLDYAPGQFLRSKSGDLICAVHGASFVLPSGQCVGGPCRGDCLRTVPVQMRDGAVYLANDA